LLNGIIAGIFVVSVLLGAATGSMAALSDAILESAKSAVTLALGLIGAMAFFLGMMQVASDGGLLQLIARGLGPVLRRLFPGIPADHPAMSAMILNMGSNMMGLGNAATPFGIKAIEEMDKLNAEQGTATNSMVLFLAINTSALALLPSGVISLRLAAGSQDATGIFLTTWFASGCATITAIAATLLLSRLPRYRRTEPGTIQADPATRDESAETPAEPPRAIPRRVAVAVAAALVFAGAFVARIRLLQANGPVSAIDLLRDEVSYWILPALIGAMATFGWVRGVAVYESWVEGAKEGFQVAVRIIPYLVVILVAVGMLRASGGIDLMATWIAPVTGLIGMPAEAIPMALVRPLSGTGAMGVMTEIMTAHGPDSLIGYMVCTMSGSTDTTFYILAVYFGAVGVKRTRHALPACLLADLAGIIASVFIVNLLYG
jgi:spore maturation protein SpmA